jgi:hypothetical protein
MLTRILSGEKDESRRNSTGELTVHDIAMPSDSRNQAGPSDGNAAFRQPDCVGSLSR